MKKLTLIALALVFTACSHKDKKTEAPAPAPVVEEKATTTADAADKKGKKKAAKAAAATEAAATDAAPAASSSSETSLAPITGTEKASYTCTNKGETRKITILNVTEGGCGVVYNKAGADTTVARAKNSLDHCDTVANKIKSNLEGAGYNCGGASSETPTNTSSSEN